MKEKPQHRFAYDFYRDMGMNGGKRSLAKVAAKFSVSETSINKWNKAFHWQERVMLHDKEIADGVQKKMMPEWIEMKAYLLKTLLEQVKKAREDGITPQTTRDMVAAIKEIRSMMGESDQLDVTHSMKLYNFDQSKYPDPTDSET